eukprot:m.137848 g.137848  ORF g.137848 m.137848 type:complete len:538 (-) comp24008_c0_seq3:85-1698(-)
MPHKPSLLVICCGGVVLSTCFFLGFLTHNFRASSSSSSFCSFSFFMANPCVHILNAWASVHVAVDTSAFFFDSGFNKCYICKPKPGRKGFVRLGISINAARAQARDVFSKKKFMKVFHGTKKQALPAILHCGYLLKPGNTTPEGVDLVVRDGHVKGAYVREGRKTVEAPNECMYVSQSLLYSAHPVYAEEVECLGTKAVFVFEFRADITTKGFHTGAHTLLSPPYDPTVKHGHMETWTNRHGVLILTGLLVKLKDQPADVTQKYPLPDPRDHRIPHQNPKMMLECPVARRCWELIEKVVIGAGTDRLFFNHRYDRCFCEKCCDERNENPFYERAGIPYIIPRGFTRFALAVDHFRTKAKGCWRQWPVCYHGTQVAALNDIIQGGMMLLPGDTNHKGDIVVSRDHQAAARQARMSAGELLDEQRTPSPGGGPPSLFASGVIQRQNYDQTKAHQIFATPSIHYASHPAHSQVVACQTKDGVYRNFTAVLQLRIQPNTFAWGPSTLRETPADDYVPQREMEWFTPRHGVHLLYGILVKYE